MLVALIPIFVNLNFDNTAEAKFPGLAFRAYLYLPDVFAYVARCHCMWNYTGYSCYLFPPPPSYYGLYWPVSIQTQVVLGYYLDNYLHQASLLLY